METKKFKLAGSGNAKGGHNNTRTTLTAAGVSAVVGTAAGFALRRGHGKTRQEVKEDVVDAQDAEQVAQVYQQEITPQQQQTVDENITEPQPVDNNTVTNPSPTDNADVTPDEVAQQIVQSNEIDANDIDADNVFTVSGFANVNGPDGEEILVAVIQAQDGSEFILADLDGDGVYSDVFDMAGNYAGEAEGNLTAGDLVIMTDDTGNYIAAVESPDGDDPIHGIVDTEPATLVAENEGEGLPEPATAESSEDELLAELTTGLDEEETSLLDRIVEVFDGEDVVEGFGVEELVDEESGEDINGMDDGTEYDY